MDYKVDISKIMLGLNIIIIGLYILLGNTGVVDFGYLAYFIKFWPLIIISIGLDMILRNYNLGYIGSVIFSIFLVLAIIASTNGPAGTSVRKFLTVPENPTSWSNYWGGWNINIFDFTPAETKSYSEKLDPASKAIVFDMSSPRIKNASIILKKSTAVSIKYDIMPRSKINGEAKLTMITDFDGSLTIKEPEKIDVDMKIKMEIQIPETTVCIFRGTQGSIEIQDDWKGGLDFAGLTNYSIKAKNLDQNFEFKTVSGSIAIGSAKNMRVETGSGNIRMEGTTGELTATTISGLVVVNSFENGTIRTTSGDISAKNAGNIEIKTISGDVKVESVGNTMSISTTSGDIMIGEFNSNSSSSKISSISGDVSVKLGKQASIKGECSSTSGDINLSGLRRTESANGFMFGDGRGSLDISTTSGDISVLER
jgi:DUF4097 and DUF4098 domain-containing protein YvlB